MFSSHSEKILRFNSKRLIRELMRENKRKKLRPRERTSKRLKNLLNKKKNSPSRRKTWNSQRK